MNYLLDTHTFIWTISEKGKLSPAVKQTIEDPLNNIFVSAITFWEISLKFSNEYNIPSTHISPVNFS